MNIKPARRRVSAPPSAEFDLWNGDPFKDERELRLLDRFIAFVIILMVGLGLLTYCTPAPAASLDYYEAERRADERQAEADRRADERMQRAEDAANLREFQRRMDADGREFSRRYEAVGTERDPYYHRRRY